MNEVHRQSLASLPLSAVDAYTPLRNGLESGFAPVAEKARHMDLLDEAFS